MTTSPHTNRASRTFAVLRWVLGIGLLAWIFSRMPMDEFVEVWSASLSQWRWWIVGLAATGIGLLAAAARWYGLLLTQGVHLPVARVFRLFFIGQFFNAFLPGACGGDIARAYYIFKETQLKRTEAVSTVLVDRGVGLLALIGFACAMLAWRLPDYIGQAWARTAGAILLALVIGGCGGVYVLFRRNVFEHRAFLQRLETNTFFGGVLRRVYNAFYIYRHHPVTLLCAIFLSLANMTGLTLACYAFGQSLQLNVSMIDYFTLFPLITVLSAIPLTPGALGLREGLFVELFAVTGTRAAQSVPLSLMVYGGGVFWSLIGGLFFLNHSTRFGVSFRDEWRKLQIEHRRAVEEHKRAAATPPPATSPE